MQQNKILFCDTWKLCVDFSWNNWITLILGAEHVCFENSTQMQLKWHMLEQIYFWSRELAQFATKASKMLNLSICSLWKVQQFLHFTWTQAWLVCQHFHPPPQPYSESCCVSRAWGLTVQWHWCTHIWSVCLFTHDNQLKQHDMHTKKGYRAMSFWWLATDNTQHVVLLIVH
mgnify:CR=1 FL=1